MGDVPVTAVLPPGGYSSPAGQLRQQLERQAPGGGPSLEPGLRITPSIGVDVGATDSPGGLYSGPGNGGADGLVVVTPGLTVSGETSRVRVNAGYFPAITRYFQTASQNTVYQNLYGSANVTVVPDTLFVQASGSIATQSRTGGTYYNNGGAGGGLGGASLNRNDQVDTTNFAVTPYLVHRFGDTGTAQVGYTFAYTSASGQDGAFGDGGTAFDPTAFNGRFAPPSRPLLTHREFASFTTGEDLGRFRSVTSVQATQYSGPGVYADARRNTIVEDVTVAINRVVALIGRVGFQDVRYSGFPPTRIDDAIWRAGVQLTPDADSRVILAYGRSDGIESAFVSGYLRPTARTRVDVSYSTGLTTDLEDLQNTNIVSDYDSAGTAYNQFTGGPVSTTGGFYGVDSNLFRLRRLAATGTLLYDRDTWSLTVADERRTIVSVANRQSAALLGTRDGGVTATLTWEHALSPVLTSSVSGSVGTNRITGPGGGSTTTLGLFAGLFHQLSPTVSTSLRYSFLQRSGTDTGLSPTYNGFSRTGTVNTVLLGIRKTF